MSDLPVFKPDFRPRPADQAVDELAHELEVFERACKKLKIRADRQSLRRWRIHSAIWHLQQLHARTVAHTGAANDPYVAPPPPPRYRATVTLQARALTAPDDLAAMLEDAARRIRNGQVKAMQDFGALGDFDYALQVLPACQHASTPAPDSVERESNHATRGT